MITLFGIWSEGININIIGNLGKQYLEEDKNKY